VVLVVMLELEILEWQVVVGQQVMVEVVDLVLYLLKLHSFLVQEELVELLVAILVVLDYKEYQKIPLLKVVLVVMVLLLEGKVDLPLSLLAQHSLPVVEEVVEDLVLVVVEEHLDLLI
jgi:hypothetical protein